MPNLEWEVPHTIVSPLGSLDLNVPDPDTGRIYRVQPDGYAIVPSLRVTQDNISQADGSVLHPRWKTGLVATMKVNLQVLVNPAGDAPEDKAEYTPACQVDLREMDDLLSLHLNALRKNSVDPNGSQRLLWTPTAYGDRRMMTDIQLLSWPAATADQDNEWSEVFALEGPFPYAIDATEIDTDIASGGGTDTIENAGNSAQSPVIRVHGPSSGFTLTNYDDVDDQGNPLAIVYDDSLPGGTTIPSGHFVELDFFRGSATLSGGAGTDVIASINALLSDFWRLQPGDNDVSITGASCTVLSNPAWC